MTRRMMAVGLLALALGGCSAADQPVAEQLVTPATVPIEQADPSVVVDCPEWIDGPCYTVADPDHPGSVIVYDRNHVRRGRGLP
jgi:PBP1b-binding outer membrane lipoprotein LpoB